MRKQIKHYNLLNEFNFLADHIFYENEKNDIKYKDKYDAIVAISKDAMSLKYCSNELRSMEDLVINAIERNPKAISYSLIMNDKIKNILKKSWILK